MLILFPLRNIVGPVAPDPAYDHLAPNFDFVTILLAPCLPKEGLGSNGLYSALLESCYPPSKALVRPHLRWGQRESSSQQLMLLPPQSNVLFGSLFPENRISPSCHTQLWQALVVKQPPVPSGV